MSFLVTWFIIWMVAGYVVNYYHYFFSIGEWEERHPSYDHAKCGVVIRESLLAALKWPNYFT